jgi:hypothetical protein
MATAADDEGDGGQQGCCDGGEEDGDLRVGQVRWTRVGQSGHQQGTVKPIPPSRPMTATSPQASSGLSWALVQVTVLVHRPEVPETATPTDRRANSGTATAADTGRRSFSARSAGLAASPGRAVADISSPIATPAMVACTPEACRRAQMTTASGPNSSQRVPSPARGQWVRGRTAGRRTAPGPLRLRRTRPGQSEDGDGESRVGRRRYAPAALGVSVPGVHGQEYRGG